MSNETTKSASSLPLARIALIVAALVAIAAIGISVWRSNAPDAAPQIAQGANGNAAQDLGGAITQLEARLKANPKDAEGWRMLGVAFYESRKFAESATAFARATQIEPGNSEYWSSLGEARVLAGSGTVPPEARTAFDKAVSIDKTDPRARYFIAVDKDLRGDHKGAIDDWLALLGDTPAGAPWEADVRRIITEVGAKQKIEVTARLAAIRPAPPSGGAAVATAGIPGPNAEQMRSASQMPKGQQDAMVQSMVDGLDAKLKTNPKNLTGWIMLMRSRLQLGETLKANAAYQSAKAAFTGDATSIKAIDDAATELGIKRG